MPLFRELEAYPVSLAGKGAWHYISPFHFLQRSNFLRRGTNESTNIQLKMDYKLAFFLVAAFLVQASFSEKDDALLAFRKQAEEDMPIYKSSLVTKTEVLNKLAELKEKADQLYQKRQAHQSDPSLESSVQVVTGKVKQLAMEYFTSETKAMETAKSHFHLLKNLEDNLKKGL